MQGLKIYIFILKTGQFPGSRKLFVFFLFAVRLIKDDFYVRLFVQAEVQQDLWKNNIWPIRTQSCSYVCRKRTFAFRFSVPWPSGLRRWTGETPTLACSRLNPSGDHNVLRSILLVKVAIGRPQCYKCVTCVQSQIPIPQGGKMIRATLFYVVLSLMKIQCTWLCDILDLHNTAMHFHYTI